MFKSGIFRSRVGEGSGIRVLGSGYRFLVAFFREGWLSLEICVKRMELAFGREPPRQQQVQFHAMWFSGRKTGYFERLFEVYHGFGRSPLKVA